MKVSVQKYHKISTMEQYIYGKEKKKITDEVYSMIQLG